ncbi:MAG: DUF6352 family protein [Rhodoferax sp.]|uniref:DUF6352 family protein n=1 Tax=Rhodoferax sp. TaxID=50421 RepID=UPI0030164181
MAPAHDFWPNCGYGLLTSDAQGHLLISDDFFRSLLLRPELAPVADSCAAEIALHARLLQTPRQEIAPDELAVLQDRDAADNYAVWLRFRARLLAEPTLEACYRALFQGEGVDVPPLLVQQLTQVVVRHLLGGAATQGVTALQARAAEMLFRTQKISVQEDGAVMAADDETVERHALSGSFGSVGELLKQGGVPLRSVDLDVLNPDNAEVYWPRSEHFDTVVSLNHGQPALDALCRVLERWIAHFLQVEVRIQTDREIVDAHWVWHVGLDAQASSILNDLYTGAEVEEDRLRRMLCLFRLEFVNPADMLAEVAGRPVYLAMAMDEQNRLKLKPQNLLLNLPLARRS